MSPEEARYYITKIRFRYLTLRLTETLVVTLSVSLVLFYFFRWINLSLFANLFFSSLSAVFVFTIRFVQLNLCHITDFTLARYLDHQHKELEESTDLLLARNDDLPLLQQLQQSRTLLQLEGLKNSIHLPHRLGAAWAVFVVCLAMVAGLSLVHRPANSTARYSSIQLPTPSANPHRNDTVRADTITVKISPPAYTRIKSSIAKDLNLILPEGSAVNWSIHFSSDIHKSYLIFYGKDTLNLSNQKDHRYSTHCTITQSGFYQLQWLGSHQELRSTDFYKIEIIQDQPPKISIDSLGQFTRIHAANKNVIHLKSTLEDDYGLQDAYIIATVSKGSGESVKFREEKMQFLSPRKIRGKQAAAERLIDLLALGMEPGDELYFYAEAWDNKTPAPNHRRTQTYFIVLDDTASETVSVDAGMGVELMPEYFRSQRQIIIDSEKLLEEKKKSKVTTGKFNDRSNALAFDQKVLRLRYDQVTGDEGETGEDLSPSNNLNEKENSLAEFTHSHGQGEETALLAQSVKAKLRTAINLMWTAELHLRLNDPAKSLPYQYTILKLLKEISNDSRLYVHRTGFDPPPINEEKRLTGDLKDVKNTSSTHAITNEIIFPHIRRLLQELEMLSQVAEPALNPQQKNLFRLAGNELAGIALEKPGINLHALSLIKSLTNGEISARKIKPSLSEIQKTLWQVLPHETTSPTQHTLTAHQLDDAFLKNWENVRHE
jgi:hypothetical protein